MAVSARKQLQEQADAIEGAYEFFLAYAAQGLTQPLDGSQVVRQFGEQIGRMSRAIPQIGVLLGRLLEEENPASRVQLDAFQKVVEGDAVRAGAAVEVVRAQEFPTSQLVDNLNASVHVRALLTDLFLLDEALRLGVDAATQPQPPKSTS
ncbi:MAG: hypothetical protein EXR92_07865 [Gemmatimonadetes bacterium]|nr:hypothetical protein [Gemmatimonadota bacterium]